MTKVLAKMNVRTCPHRRYNAATTTTSIKGKARTQGRMQAMLGGRGDSQEDKKLIVPGDSETKRKVDSLVGLKPEQSGGGGSSLHPTSFKLPAGFMNSSPSEQQQEEEEIEFTTEEMIMRLQEKAGYWHDLAPFVSKLQAEGVEHSVIEQVSGITALEQNQWIVSLSVYKTLKERNLAASVMDSFDREGYKTLYPLRRLTGEDRQAVAEYISQNDLNGDESEELVRAVREHERRKGDDKNAFESNPGDCLAYKYYRDALEETRDPAAKADIVNKGLERATSESAKEALNALLESDEEGEGVAKGKITILALDRDEIDTSLIAVAGNLKDISLSQIQSATKSIRQGVFGMITVSKLEEQWVVLPLFQPMVRAKDPIAIKVDQLEHLKEFGAQTRGNAILVIDRVVLKDQIEPESVYLISHNGSDISLCSGGEVMSKAEEFGESLEVCGKALLCCRPPGKSNDEGDAVQVVGQ